MKNAEGASRLLRFADLEVDLERRTVRRAGRPLRIASTSFDLLRCLIDRHPDIVTHRELIAAVWAGRCVTLDALTQRIRLLRKALGEADSDMSLVVSVHGQGYRLAAPRSDTANAAPTSVPLSRNPAPRVVAYFVLIAISVALASLAILGPHPVKHFFKHLLS